MADLFKMLDTFKTMQGRLQETQEAMAQQSFTGTAGGGTVSVVCDGKLQITQVRIDPSVVAHQDASLLEDLVLVATNDAQRQAATAMQESMRALTGGIDLPFKLPF